MFRVLKKLARIIKTWTSTKFQSNLYTFTIIFCNKEHVSKLIQSKFQ